MSHLKRIRSPDSWNILKKQNKWVTRPSPGPHKLEDSIPLSIIVKNLLNYANTTKESKRIIKSKKILVDNYPRTNHRYPLGMMDIIEIPSTKQSFLLLLAKNGKFKLTPIKNKSLKYLQVLNKKTLKGKKIQLNLSSGRNLIVDKDNYKTGDTIILDITSNKIKSHIPFEKGASVYITAGKHIGNFGKIVDIHKFKSKKEVITVEISNHKYETLKDYAFIVDRAFIENEGTK